MSTIAILGTGRVASGLALRLAAAGHDVIVGSRDDRAPDWLQPPLRLATTIEAIGTASIVVNATPGDSSLERLSALEAELAGRILVDVANATVHTADGLPGGLLYPNGSLAEELQKALPRTRVVKTLNTMLFTVMAAPELLRGPATIFVSGDDAAAKATVNGLLGDLGWPPEAKLDLGGIRTARGPEAMVLLVADLVQARGFAPFAITVTT
jgi:predicted dinucleotide-binding enzyme